MIQTVLLVTDTVRGHAWARKHSYCLTSSWRRGTHHLRPTQPAAAPRTARAAPRLSSVSGRSHRHWELERALNHQQLARVSVYSDYRLSASPHQLSGQLPRCALPDGVQYGPAAATLFGLVAVSRIAWLRRNGRPLRLRNCVRGSVKRKRQQHALLA